MSAIENRLLRSAVLALLRLAVVVPAAATTTTPTTGGTSMTWWMLEIATCLVLVAMALWRGRSSSDSAACTPQTCFLTTR